MIRSMTRGGQSGPRSILISRSRRGWSTDAGAGSVVTVAVIAALILAVGLCLPIGAVLADRQRAAGAADAAALAAADVAIGIRGGSPCAAAEVVSSANGAGLTSCVVDGVIVTVGVRIVRGVLPIAAVATAGPPP